jgi:hypothetical protein
MTKVLLGPPKPPAAEPLAFDRTTKLLLAAIAVGVWALVLKPAPADHRDVLDNIDRNIAAAVDALSRIEGDLSNIETNTATTAANQ